MPATESVRAALAVVLLLSFAACDTPPGPSAAVPSPTPTSSETAGTTPAARPPTTTPALRLYVDAAGAARRRVERAIRDLKAVSMWRGFTEHLFILRIQTRAGEKRVPGDGHLADAGLAVHVDPTGAGLYCYIRIWPAALERDLANQRTYYSEGRLGFVPPSERIFWASILGHELGHCRGRRKVTPEDVALEWENRVRDALSTKVEPSQPNLPVVTEP